MKHVKDLILLKKLGFHGLPLDYALSETEGVVLYYVELNHLTFEMKTLTNSFTPGLFQYVCAACATLGKGDAAILIPSETEASFNHVFDESALKQAATGTPRRRRMSEVWNKAAPELQIIVPFDYGTFKI